MDQLAIRELVEQILLTLPEAEREALLLRYVEDLSVREIGRIMGRTEKAVESLLRRTDSDSSVLLDGFPRTVEQAKALDRMLADLNRNVDFVVALDVPEPLLVDRLLHRAAVEGRADDTREAIMERMHEYRMRTAAVLDHYRRSGVPVAEVDGVGAVDEVFDRVRDEIKSVLNGKPQARGI